MGLLDKQLTFGGEVIPAWIASAPHIIRSERKTTITPIAGTNRELVEMEDAWEPYDQPYTLFVGDGTEDSIRETIDEIARILHKKDWQILLDDYDPDHYRMAYYKDSFDVENRYTRAGKFKIIFRCRAERYLMEGNDPETVESGDTMTNPTAYASKPLIRVEGTGTGTLTIEGQTIELEGMTDYLIIDSDRMDVYRQPTENKNNLMSGEFPVLKAGDNTIAYSGGITSVTITPRYFII